MVSIRTIWLSSSGAGRSISDATDLCPWSRHADRRVPQARHPGLTYGPRWRLGRRAVPRFFDLYNDNAGTVDALRPKVHAILYGVGTG